MKNENIDPNDVVSRALLLMKYDTKKTLTENIDDLDEDINMNQNVSDGFGWFFDDSSGKAVREKIDGNVKRKIIGKSGRQIVGKSSSSAKVATQIANQLKQTATGGASNVTINNVLPGGAADAAAGAVGNATSAASTLQGLASITGWKSFGSFIASPIGVGALAALSYWIYTVNRSAGNEEKLRNAVKACKISVGKGQRDALQKEGLLKDSQRNDAAKLYYQGITNQNLESGFSWSFGQGWGTDEKKIIQANKLIKNGNMADLCIVMLKYEQMTDGTDFASDMAGDLSEGELSDVIAIMQNMVDPYAGGGVKVIPEDSFNIAFYKEEYPCVFQTKDTFVSGPKKDPDGFTYIVIKGSQRKSSSGKIYNRLYRLYADGSRLQLAHPTLPKETNAKLVCQGTVPTAEVQGAEGGEVGESLYERYLRKNPLNEVFDDRLVKVTNIAVGEDELEGWEDGKKVAAWPSWLKKFPCLRTYFPSGTPVTDEMGYTYFVNVNPKNNKKYRFYSDGDIWNEEATKSIGKRWYCAERGGKVIVESRRNLMEQIPFDIEGETDVTTTTTTNANTTVTPNANWKKCLDFPYTQGCYNYKIGEVQSCLGVKPIDAKFGPITLKALKDKGYGEEISKDVYDKVMAACPANPSNKKPDANPNANPDVNKSTNLGPNDLIATTEV